MNGAKIMKPSNKKPYNNKYPCENAFLTNPVASVNDVTGYVQRMPDNSDAAENYATLFDVPVSGDEDDDVKKYN